MGETLLYIALSLGSACLGAIANILANILLRGLRAQDLLGPNFAFMAVAMLVTSPLFFEFNATKHALALLAVVLVLDSLGNLLYFMALRAAPATHVSPILAFAPLFALVSSNLVLNETHSVPMYLAISISVVAVAYLAADRDHGTTGKSAFLFTAIGCAALFGISAVPSKMLLTGDSINPPSLYLIRALVIASFGMMLSSREGRLRAWKSIRGISIRGVVVIVQWLLFYFALQFGPAGTVTTLSYTTPVFVCLITIVFLRERVSSRRLAAAVIAVSLVVCGAIAT